MALGGTVSPCEAGWTTRVAQGEIVVLSRSRKAYNVIKSGTGEVGDGPDTDDDDGKQGKA